MTDKLTNGPENEQEVQERTRGMDMAWVFLSRLFKGALALLTGQEIYIRFLLVWRGDGDGPEGRTCVFHFPSLDEAREGLRILFNLNDQGYDVFVGVNLRWLRSGAKSAVRAASVIHCEIDATLNLLAADIERLAKAVGASFRVVSGPTGGQHVYFILDELIDPAHAEVLNKILAQMLSCKDAVHDVSRHLRVAGTINNKPEYRGMSRFRAMLINEKETK
ncbi:MAG: hypothetical protein ABIK09_18475 [Pseudomonadota bacterium]